MTPDEVRAWDDYIRGWVERVADATVDALKHPKRGDKPRLSAADIIFLREVGIQL